MGTGFPARGSKRVRVCGPGLPGRMKFANPGFPVELNGVDTVHAPFLTERRTRGPVWRSVQEIRGISLVFREMWDTTHVDR